MSAPTMDPARATAVMTELILQRDNALARCTNFAADVITLQGALAEAKAKITTLEDALATAQARITTLEADLAAASADAPPKSEGLGGTYPASQPAKH